MRKERIGIDLCWIGSSSNPGAVHALTTALEVVAEQPPDDIELVLYGLGTLRSEFPSLAEAFETHTLPIPAGNRVLRVGAEYAWLRRELGRHRIDVLHAAGGTSPGSVDVPRVVSVDDLSPLEQPRGVNPLRVAYHRRVVPRTVSAATTVVVPSEFVRSRLVDHLGTDPAKVHVVPWPLPPHAPAAPIDTVRARYGIIGQIILLPAATNAQEEHVVAVRAMQHLASRHKETTLVLAGGQGAIEQRVLDEVAERGVDDRVVRIDDMSEAVRSSLFEHAAAVVYPAIYGGFASAVLEAMASAIPVIVADAGAAPEVVGDAGAVIPPGDDAQLAIELHRVLEDRAWRDRMVEAGLDRARTYRPERTAAGLLAAYRSVMVGL